MRYGYTSYGHISVTAVVTCSIPVRGIPMLEINVHRILNHPVPVWFIQMWVLPPYAQ